MAEASCRQLLRQLSDYLEGQASELVCAEIERHLADCEDCQVVVDTLRKTVLLYQQLPRPSFAQQAQRRLFQALDLSEYLEIGSPSR